MDRLLHQTLGPIPGEEAVWYGMVWYGMVSSLSRSSSRNRRRRGKPKGANKMEQLQYCCGGLGFLPKARRSPCVLAPQQKPNQSGVVARNSKKKPTPSSGKGALHGNKDDNVWSIDNDAAKAERDKEAQANARTRGRRKKKKRQQPTRGDKVLVSGSMLVELETVLQTQEPVIRPIWSTFSSSLSGIWKGVGAVFSPITAQMEPIDVGSKGELLYDCYTLSRVESSLREIRRKVSWVTLNPHGECRNGGTNAAPTLPDHGSFDFQTSDVMEEDVMGHEPGLAFFEDGSYSRGPIELPVGDAAESQYCISPTFKFEQCLVKGCHRRLRVVHTIEFSEGGSDIQIMRVAVYEEQWVSPANLPDLSDSEFDMEPLSQRKRTKPSELTGSWKVFEVSATPVFGDTMSTEDSNGPSYAYLCMETLKKRSLPESPVYFGEEEMVQDVTVLWLPGGVTGYVDVSRDGILCIGVGWYSEEGINLVMERDYGVDGKLEEVRYKSEVKRRWSDPIQT